MSKGKPVLAVFFDVRKAYDSVWISKLLYKLHLSGINGYMFHAIKSLITNRSFCVKIGGSKSSLFSLDMGVPQGSVLSPLIFNLMISDIEKIRLKSCKMTLYADDLTIWMTPKKYKNLFKTKVCMYVKKQLQVDIDKILVYMKQSGFQLSPEKTNLIVFSGRHKIDNTNIFIEMNNIKIYPSKKAKYLGVVFDDHLSWKPHIEEMIRKTDMVWGILKTLRTTPGGNHIPSMLTVIRSLVRSKLSYGQETYFSANKNILKMLQIKECHFLRYALGLAPGTPQDRVYNAAGWLPLNKERKLRCAQYYFRSKTVENSTNQELHPNYDNLYYNESIPPPENNRNSVQRCIPYHYYIRDVLNNAKLNDIEMNPIDTLPIPPWLLIPCHFDLNYADSYTKKDDQLQISSLAKERIHCKYQNHLKVYTDGSKLQSGDVGCAFYIHDFKLKRQYKLNNDISIFSAELFAMCMALSYINDIPRTLTQVIILSDSKSVLQALNSSVSKNRADLINECKLLIHQIMSKGIDLVLMWVPSHSGIQGNDCVDLEAKKAAEKEMIDFDIGLSLSEIYSKLKISIEKEWSEMYKNCCQERNWIYYEDNSSPPLSCHILPLFYRLRAGYLKYHYNNVTCVCNDLLSFHHIFECNDLIPKFDRLHDILDSLNLNPTPKILLSKNENVGWKITETFLQSLLNSDVGHLI